MDPDHAIRLEALEKQCDSFQEVGATLLTILEGLKGPDNGARVGLFEQVRGLEAEVKHLRSEIQGLVGSVKILEETRQRLIGVYVVGGLVGGIVSFAVSFFAHPK